MRCPNCGCDLPDTAKMCWSCKSVFQQIPTTTSISNGIINQQQPYMQNQNMTGQLQGSQNTVMNNFQNGALNQQQYSAQNMTGQLQGQPYTPMQQQFMQNASGPMQGQQNISQQQSTTFQQPNVTSENNDEKLKQDIGVWIKTIPVIIKSLVIIVVGIIVLIALWGGKSGSGGSGKAKGYDTPEDAVNGFLSAWDAHDINAMINASLPPELIACEDEIVLRWNAYHDGSNNTGYKSLNQLYEFLFFRYRAIYTNDPINLSISEIEIGEPRENIRGDTEQKIYLKYNVNLNLEDMRYASAYCSFPEGSSYKDGDYTIKLQCYKVDGKWYAAWDGWSDIMTLYR